MQQYDIKLKPHHAKAYLTFVEEKLYQLSDAEYIARFRLKNGNYHSEEFIMFWRNFLLYLYQNQNLKFLYTQDFDAVCKDCDLRKECENPNSTLHQIVKTADIESLSKLNLEENCVYLVRNIRENYSQHS